MGCLLPRVFLPPSFTLGYLQRYQEGVCSCQECWMLQVSSECAITAGDSPFPPFPGA